MEQSESSGVVTTEPDFPRRKLDFAVMCRATATAILPEHPQARLQSKLLALAQSQAPPPPFPPQSPPPQPSPKQPVRPVKPQPQPIMPQSPKSRQRSDSEVKEGTPKKQKSCNCRYSQCLKLYCECFSRRIYCDGCNCTNCHNNVEHDATRQEAVGATLERNPNAFKLKILNSPHGLQDGKANILCSENCKCMDCKNFEGSEERTALVHVDRDNYISYLQQPANAAINEAIGTSHLGALPASKMGSSFSAQWLVINLLGWHNFHRKTISELLSHLLCYHPLFLVLLQQHRVDLPNLSYKSPLADVLRPQDVKELCSLLVIVSAEATKALADKNGKIDKQVGDQLKSSIVSSAPDKYCQMEDNMQKSIPEDRLSVNQVGRADDSGSDESDAQTRRPLPPATLALMCDEHDVMLVEPGSPTAAANSNGTATCKSSQGQIITEHYAEQERIVLTKFWDFLNQTVTCGSIKVFALLEAPAVH
ncbi:Protein tesmin/TSO1-like [Actinidia chinensis var. chinensis]|uniref:Protein tesmin/TSO1-like n=1 Tax=Actinidia chinensis var. chinensis TaxID=1590841 RepID=A0A2R6PHA4_ACTCC|nr:Protein tesmin/TSO1-like [Actinidia chinensis var. chinensis]